MNMQKLSLQEFSDLCDESEVLEQVDLGPAFLLRGRNSVTGDFIAISTSEGSCAIIKT